MRGEALWVRDRGGWVRRAGAAGREGQTQPCVEGKDGDPADGRQWGQEDHVPRHVMDTVSPSRWWAPGGRPRGSMFHWPGAQKEG